MSATATPIALDLFCDKDSRVAFSFNSELLPLMHNEAHDRLDTIRGNPKALAHN